MGFLESLPTYLSLILRDHYTSKQDKPCLVKHWRLPNAYGTHLFLPFLLSHPHTGWLDLHSTTPPSPALVWSTAAAAAGPAQLPAHGRFIWWLEEKPIPPREVLTWYISGEEPGAVCEGEVRKWLLINHLPREAWQEKRSQGEPREEASSQAAVYTGCRM